MRQFASSSSSRYKESLTAVEDDCTEIELSVGLSLNGCFEVEKKRVGGGFGGLVRSSSITSLPFLQRDPLEVVVLDGMTRSFATAGVGWNDSGVPTSIWIVDLAYLLHKFSVRFSFFTMTIGANPEFSAEPFYKVRLFFRQTFWEFSWDVMEPVAFFTTTTGLVVGYAYFLFTSRDPTYQDLTKRLFLSRQRKLFQK